MATQGNILQAGYTDLSTLVDNQTEISSPFDILPNSAPSELSNYQMFSTTLDWYYEGSWSGYVVNPKMIFQNPFTSHNRPQLTNPVHAFNNTNGNSLRQRSIIKIDNVWHIRALFRDSPVSGDWAQILWRLKPGQTTFDTSTWDAVGRDEILVTDSDSPISIEVVEVDSSTPTAWSDAWVVNSDGTELIFASDNTQGNTGLGPMTTLALNYPSTDDSTDDSSGDDSTDDSSGDDSGTGDDSSGDTTASDVGKTINGRTIVARNETGQFGTNSMKDSVVYVDSNVDFVVDSVVYQQKVNYSHEQIISPSSVVYPCVDNTSEYEVINLGSDALNYSDTNVNVTLSGFYAV